MPMISSLLDTVRGDFPGISFEKGDTFKWSPPTATITYDEADPHGAERLLHEISHAELAHNEYRRDIELIAMERDAWHHAKTILSERYAIPVAADIIEDDLDTYRDWMHARSICPKCDSNGIQTGNKEYTCVACKSKWRVNQAISCELRRYNQKPH